MAKRAVVSRRRTRRQEEQQQGVVPPSPTMTMLRVVLDIPATGETKVFEMAKELAAITGVRIKLDIKELAPSGEVLVADAPLEHAEERPVRRTRTVAVAGGARVVAPAPHGRGRNAVVYRVLDGRTPVSERMEQVRSYILSQRRPLAAREIWEGLEQATGETHLQKAVESALYGLRTSRMVESVAVVE
jgi:hypothetical protein